MDEIGLVQRLAVIALPLIFAITVHEAAHGYVAGLLGDDTARRMGRITANPLPHIDPIGTLLVPALAVLLIGFAIGWAKPVPVDFRRLRNPKRDSALVAIAGPGVNLAMAIGWSLVLSGMRPTGRLHLGHYHGVLKNWVELQHEYECFFFVADWHALTTDYDDPSRIPQSTWDMVIDWLAAGVNPGEATLFVQSRVPEHAELHLLLSMITPLGWLERVPTYKDQQEKLKEKDLATYGFLGYPLLQSADILVYRAGLVPVGEDQVAHVEMTREIARRFNHIYGREPDFEERPSRPSARWARRTPSCSTAAQGLPGAGRSGGAGGRRRCSRPAEHHRRRPRAPVRLSGGRRQGHPAGAAAAADQGAKMPGLDGQKMSKSYGNTIALRDDPTQVEKKLRTMPTDPRGCAAPTPATRRSARSGSSTRSTPTTTPGLGAAGLPQRRHRLHRVQAAGHRCGAAELEPIQERAASTRPARGGAQAIINEGCERPARSPARPWTRCATPCRWTTERERHGRRAAFRTTCGRSRG
jgi:tryptophanyl-tRNA synthetase